MLPMFDDQQQRNQYQGNGRYLMGVKPAEVGMPAMGMVVLLGHH